MIYTGCLNKGLSTKVMIMTKILLILGLTIASLPAEVNMYQTLPLISLADENGGYYNGEAWDSSILQGKTTLLMYVDPDENSKGEVFKPSIEAFEEELDFRKFQILVIINLQATWKPIFMIRSFMKNKVTDFPKRTYVLDNNSVLVKKWGLTDNEYNTLVIDRESKVVYSHSGIWKKDEITQIDRLIRSQVK
jgi:predicted transcriptional regulator